MAEDANRNQSSPWGFPHKLTQALEGLPGIYTIADDVRNAGECDTLQDAGKDHDN